MKINTFRFIGFSIFCHIVLFSGFSFYVTKSATPYIFMWPNILDKSELFSKEKEVKFIEGIKFIPAAGVSKEYFLPYSGKPYFEIVKDRPNQEINAESSAQNQFEGKKEPKSVYLWDRPSGLNNNEEDTPEISYKAFVSPYGKVILSFPEKLSLNSAENITSQEYNRQAILFLKDKFFWTKWEAVVR